MKSRNERFMGRSGKLWPLAQLAKLDEQMHSCLAELVLVESRWRCSHGVAAAADDGSIAQWRLRQTWSREAATGKSLNAVLSRSIDNHGAGEASKKKVERRANAARPVFRYAGVRIWPATLLISSLRSASSVLPATQETAFDSRQMVLPAGMFTVSIEL